MRNFNAKILAMPFPLCSYRASGGNPNQQYIECTSVCLHYYLDPDGLMLPVSFYVQLFKWQNVGHLLYVCLMNLFRSKMFIPKMWKVSHYWTWNNVIQNEPIFVLVKAEGVGFVFLGRLFGGLRPALSVSLLLVWACSSFFPWPPYSPLFKYWKESSSRLSFMNNF